METRRIDEHCQDNDQQRPQDCRNMLDADLNENIQQEGKHQERDQHQEEYLRIRYDPVG